MLRDNCARHADALAVVDGATALTYGELWQYSDDWLALLAARDVGPGVRVCIWSHNSWQWIVAATAVWRLGATLVPISSRLKALDARAIIDKSRARVLLATADCGGTDLPGLLLAEFGAGEDHPVAGLPTLASIVSLDEQPAPMSSTAGAAGGQEAAFSGEEIAEILFTSGTTGEPKGVMLNHRQVLQAYWDWSDQGGLRAGDRFLVVPPFSHGFGINAGILACLMRGMTHVVVGFFDPGRTLELVAAHGITVMSGAPALFSRLCESAGAGASSPLASVRVVYVGAAHVAPALIEALRDVHGIDRVINAYGLIEGCVVSMTRADDPVVRIASSVGRALPGVEVAICDEQGTALPPGRQGEIRVRGYGVMQGYLEAPHLTREALTEDGWLRTGDAGVLDSDAYLSIVGRLKEMYITNGFNVYPAEIEDYLLQHPAVHAVAVVGVADSARGEAGVAFAVGETRCESSDPLAWLREKIASYKVPARLEWVEALPLNDNGKVRKDVLAQWASQQDSKRMGSEV